nr:AsmA-like C-terminal region-containing protein [Ancylobacter tetraedralis]
MLLTIASAIILAVAAAFAAPFVVDWTQWRATFEAQAARAVGVPVIIRGPIEAQILPTPKFVLHDVSVGVDSAGTGLAAAALSGRLSLGALMRGEFVADGLTLVRPRIRLVVDATGTLTLPTGAGRPAGLTIGDLTIENGTLDLLDRAGGRSLRLDDIDLAGELGGVLGPLRLEGEVASAGVRRKLRLSLAQAQPDGTTKLRLGVQSIGSPFTVDADGTLAFPGGRPAFQGRASLSMRAMEAAPGAAQDPLAGWSLAGTVNATPQAVDATNLSLSLGSGERPVELSGRGRLAAVGTPDQPAARLELSLAARQIDLNAATGGASPIGVIDRFAQTIAPLTGLATSGTLDLASDTVLLGGAAMREVKAGLDWSPAGWRARAIEARLPGRASIKLSGRLPQAAGTPSNDALFAGDMVLSAEDLPAFIGWAAPDATSLIAGLPTGAAELKGTVALAADRIALDRMNLRLGDTSLAGTAAYVFASPGGRGRIDAALSTAKVDIDTLLPPARKLLGYGGDRFDVRLSFSGTSVRLAGIDAAGADIILRSDAGGYAVERLAIANFGGLDLNGSGRLTATGASAAADGRFQARLTGARADGLPALARALGLAPVEAFASSMGADLAPLDVALDLTSQAGRTALDAKGRLGVLSGTAQLGFGAGRPMEGTLALDMSDGSAVLSTLGVPGLRAGLGPARATLALGSELDGTLSVAGATLTARGKLDFEADARARPNLALALADADLVQLFSTFPAGTVAALPASLSGTLTREGNGWQLAGLDGSLAGQKIAGRATYLPGETLPVEADLSLDTWSLPAALGLAVGPVTGPVAGAGSGWPDARFGTPALGGLAARVKLNLRRLELPAGLALDGARLQARLTGTGVAVEELTGALAGGRFSGRFDLTRRAGEAVQFDGHLALSDADSALLLQAADVTRPAVRGRVTLALDLTGSGRSPRAIAAALQGQGSLVVDGLEIAYADPRALQYVMLATERGLPPDQARTVQLLNEGLSRGPLKLDRLESALSVVGGVARTATARASVGAQRFTFTGSLDIPALSFETTLEIEDAAAAGQGSAPGAATGAPPSAGVQWRGPIAAPERRFDITPLIAAINMRALERETKRLESEYGRTPLTEAGHATDEAPAPSAAPQPQQLPARPAVQPPKAFAAPPQQRPATIRPVPPAAPSLPFPMQPGTDAPLLAPPLAPPIDIPPDPLRNPVAVPPMAP